MSVSNCTQTAQTAKLKRVQFKLNNAYDVVSADELYQLLLSGVIVTHVIEDDIYTLMCTDIEPVEQIMLRHRFTYSVDQRGL